MYRQRAHANEVTPYTDSYIYHPRPQTIPDIGTTLQEGCVLVPKKYYKALEKEIKRLRKIAENKRSRQNPKLRNFLYTSH